MRNKQLTTIAVASLAVVALAGCTGSDPSPKGSAPSASSTPADDAAGSEYAIPDVSGECVDGTATIVDDSSNVTIDGDCADVVVEASNSVVTVTGAVVNLTFNSSITLVNVATVDTIVFVEGANGNKAATSSTPVVTDAGEGNTVAAE
ncbi:hypothetical protein SAMN06295974_3930 [Plantibacter flavus]|uniref:DUF3060 domain-containing protein n=1 Tax=Plantibacter flavus TaxID=150123 RepID=A0A3N2BY86_9MICO|nr:hypothetical protein [Plantibacter flavus]ROR80219.1 hypothetical protein EDD42_0256 [Plantibacter flavus]SMG50400.1 hypothetical protein SAMN06295974_3930 [Plantibacter flavus]